jgi:hypothetical protein
MKTLATTILTTCTLALTFGVATAQNPGGPPPGGGEGGRRPRPLIDTALDINGDETIDAGELAAASASLRKLDRNEDGQLTADEYRRPHPDGRGPGDAGGEGRAGLSPSGGQAPGEATSGRQSTGGRPLPPIVSALDVNGDGVIDASEIANAAVALRKLDTNGDGKLTPDEYRPPRPDASGQGHAQSGRQQER